MAKIKWNANAFAEIRTSPAMMEAVQSAANELAAKANSGLKVRDGANGDGYVATPVAATTGNKPRARAAVVTGDISAIIDEAKNHTLERLL